MREEFNIQGFDPNWITVQQGKIDQMTAMIDVYRLASSVQPSFSTSFVRRVILGMDDDKPKFKYGK
jgi:hypothetical protein